MNKKNSKDEIFNIADFISKMEQVLASGKSNEDAYTAHAILVDYANAEKDDLALIKSIELADVVEAQCSPRDACLVRYNRANAWAGLYQLRLTDENKTSWEQAELLQQIYWLRSAIQHEGYAQLPAPRKAQLHCNLGNALSEVGRFVDALEEWRRALREQPILGMARGNLGRGLITYGMSLHEKNDAYWLFKQGQQELAAAVAGGVGKDGSTYPEAIEFFQKSLARISSMLGSAATNNNVELPILSLGRSRKEQKYRQWVLERYLFLNPLNDIGINSAAAQDILMLPSHRGDQVGITYLAFFNQLKQEFAYARWNLYEGSVSQSLHPADRHVMLSFNCDNALYFMGLEQIKMAFRSAYSLLDKVAFFINSYWKLGIDERNVSFRNVWFEDKRKGNKEKAKIRKDFLNSKNLPLRGLFWLSKDIYFLELREVAHPNAKDLDLFRNHLEHKYVKVVDSVTELNGLNNIFRDELAIKVEREELIAKTEHLLKLSRSALIYLCLAMHYEERNNNSSDLLMPLEVLSYPDSLKN